MWIIKSLATDDVDWGELCLNKYLVNVEKTLQIIYCAIVLRRFRNIIMVRYQKLFVIAFRV